MYLFSVRNEATYSGIFVITTNVQLIDTNVVATNELKESQTMVNIIRDGRGWVGLGLYFLTIGSISIKNVRNAELETTPWHLTGS